MDSAVSTRESEVLTLGRRPEGWTTPMVAGVLLVFLALQIVFLLGRHAAPFSDMQDYDARALLLLADHTFQDGTMYGATYHGPGYLVFLAGIYWLAGHSWSAVYLAQALLSTLTLFGIYLVSARLFSSRPIGVASLVLGAAYVPFIAYAQVLMPEALFLALVVFATYAFIRGVDTGSLLWLGISGVLCAAAALTRSIALPLPLVFLFSILLMQNRRAVLRRTKMGLAVFVVCMAAVMAPWTIHNYLDQGLLIPSDSIGGLNLLIGNHEGAEGTFDEAPVWTNPVVRAAVNEGKRQGELDAVFRSEALEWIIANPGKFVGLTMRRMQFFLFTTDDWLMTEMGSNVMDGLLRFRQYFTYALMLLGVGGGVVGLWRGRRTLLPLLCILYFFVVVSVFYFQTRYRLPAMPFVVVLAGYGLSVAGTELKGLVGRRRAAAARV